VEEINCVSLCTTLHETKFPSTDHLHLFSPTVSCSLVPSDLTRVQHHCLSCWPASSTLINVSRKLIHRQSLPKQPSAANIISCYRNIKVTQRMRGEQKLTKSRPEEKKRNRTIVSYCFLSLYHLSFTILQHPSSIQLPSFIIFIYLSLSFFILFLTPFSFLLSFLSIIYHFSSLRLSPAQCPWHTAPFVYAGN
jgi:hypothetical protein